MLVSKGSTRKAHPLRSCHRGFLKSAEISSRCLCHPPDRPQIFHFEQISACIPALTPKALVWTGEMLRSAARISHTWQPKIPREESKDKWRSAIQQVKPNGFMHLVWLWRWPVAWSFHAWKSWKSQGNSWKLLRIAPYCWSKGPAWQGSSQTSGFSLSFTL